MAQLVKAWYGMAGTEWMARLGMEGTLWQARRGLASQGPADHGRHGWAWIGLSRGGMAGRGLAGKVWAAGKGGA